MRTYHVVEYLDTARPRFGVVEHRAGEDPRVIRVWSIRAFAERHRDELAALAEAECEAARRGQLHSLLASA